MTDPDNNCIKVFDNKGKFLYKFGKPGTGDGEFSRPLGLCVDSNNSMIVCNGGNTCSDFVQKFTLDGQFVGKSKPPIKNYSRVAWFSDGTIIALSYSKGCFCLLK